MNVKDLMSKNIICGNIDSTISQIAMEMKKNDIGILPICTDSGLVQGVITDRDLILRFFANTGSDLSALSEKKVGDIMSTNVVSVTPDMNTHDAGLIMSKHQLRRLPVLQNDKLVGMLSLYDYAKNPVYIDEAGDILFAITKPHSIT